MSNHPGASHNVGVFELSRLMLLLGAISLLAVNPLPVAAESISRQATQSALRAAGEFLVVNDPLEPAAVIVILDGGSPERETEAAALYKAGWAPRLILVPGTPHADDQSGSAETAEWAARYELLIRLGVPAAAIGVANGQARRTLDELELASAALGQSTAPVILVTSKAHARRVAVIWQVVTSGSQRGIVRVATQDRFDPSDWWQHRDSELAAIHEFAGLIGLVGEALGASGRRLAIED